MDDIKMQDHTLNYAKNQLVLTGVKEVASFEDKEINLNLNSGGMVIKGTGLNVSELNLKSGFLRIDGGIESIAYTRSHERINLVKRLFK